MFWFRNKRNMFIMRSYLDANREKFLGQMFLLVDLREIFFSELGSGGRGAGKKL